APSRTNAKAQARPCLHAEAPARPSLSRKSRRPLLDETRNPFAKIGAAERDDHFAVGLNRCLRQGLEWYIVELPLDHSHGAWRHEISKVARVGVGLLAQLLRRKDTIDETDAQSLLTANAPRGQQQIEGIGVSHEARQHPADAMLGNQPAPRKRS